MHVQIPQTLPVQTGTEQQRNTSPKFTGLYYAFLALADFFSKILSAALEASNYDTAK